MKKIYSAPVMYREAYVMDQYIAASDCRTHVGTPPHGHFASNHDDYHCAFTSSNCGANADSCIVASSGVSCDVFPSATHTVITKENGHVIGGRPNRQHHNCHVLSSKEAAVAFVDQYNDTNCANGVATLMGYPGGGFEIIETAFS